jgi:hypothetical protein
VRDAQRVQPVKAPSKLGKEAVQGPGGPVHASLLGREETLLVKTEPEILERLPVKERQLEGALACAQDRDDVWRAGLGHPGEQGTARARTIIIAREVQGVALLLSTRRNLMQHAISFHPGAFRAGGGAELQNA